MIKLFIAVVISYLPFVLLSGDSRKFDLKSALAIFEKYNEFGCDALELILSDPSIFKQCMKAGYHDQESRLYFEAFVIEKDRLTNICSQSELEKYRKKPFSEESGLWISLCSLFEKCSVPEKVNFSTFLKSLPFKYALDLSPRQRKMYYCISNLKPCVEDGKELCTTAMLNLVAGEELVVEDYVGMRVVRAMLEAVIKNEIYDFPNYIAAASWIARSNEELWDKLPSLVVKQPGISPIKRIVTAMEESEDRSALFTHWFGLLDDVEMRKHVLLELIESDEYQIAADILFSRPSKKLFVVFLKMDETCVGKVIGQLLENDPHLDTFFATMHTLTLSSTHPKSPYLRVQLESHLNIDRTSGQSDKSVQDYAPFEYINDDVLEIILFKAASCMAFAQSVLKIVCRKWHALVDSESIILKSPAVASQFIMSWLYQQSQLTTEFPALGAHWYAFPIMIFSNFNIKELRLKIWDLSDCVDLILEMANVSFSGKILNSLCLADREVFEYVYETLPNSPLSSNGDRLTLARTLLPLLNLHPIETELRINVGLTWLNSMVIDGVVPDIYKEVFDRVFGQIDFSEDLHIPLQEHILYGRHAKVIMDKIRSDVGDLDESALIEAAVDDLNGAPFFWLASRYLAKQVMNGKWNDIVEIDYPELFFLAAFLDAESSDQFSRIFQYMKSYMDDPFSLKDAFYKGLCLLIEDTDFDQVHFISSYIR